MLSVHSVSIDDVAQEYPHGYRDRDVLIVFYYVQPHSMREIAEGFGVTTQTVLKYMKEYDLPRRDGGFS